MNFSDITDKLKDTIIPKDNKKEDLEIKETDKKEIVEDDIMEYEQKPISDEVEFINNQPMKIKTVFVRSEDEEIEEDKKNKIKGTVKIAAGIGLVAVAGITAFLLGSKRKRW